MNILWNPYIILTFTEIVPGDCHDVKIEETFLASFDLLVIVNANYFRRNLCHSVNDSIFLDTSNISPRAQETVIKKLTRRRKSD